MHYYALPTPKRELLLEVQRRLPLGRQTVQEAFTTDHRHPVVVRIAALTANTFYVFDDITAQAFGDAVLEVAAHQSGDEFTITYPFKGEFRAHQRRLQLLAPKLASIHVLGVDAPRKASTLSGGVNFTNITGSPLVRYRIALREGTRPLLFICHDTRSQISTGHACHLGFFTFDAETVREIADDIEQLLHGETTQMPTFARLELLHRTTQRVTRELESYSRRVDLVIQRARRRPDLLTPARLDKILNQAVAKMRQLEEIPRRAVHAIERSAR